MKTQDTIAGNYYGITSPNGCTVTDELGKLKKTVEAGDQLTVQAPGAKLIVDDDEAVIIKAPFNRAASVLRLLGGGVKSELPAGYLRAEFLESTGAQYINTEIVPHDLLGIELDAIQTAGVGADVYLCGVYQAPNRFYPWLLNGAGKGAFYVGWNLGFQGTGYFYQKRTRVCLNYKNNRKFTANADDSSYELALSEQLQEFTHPLPLFSAFNGSGYSARFTGKMYSANVTNGAEISARFIPAVDYAGAPCLFELKKQEPFYNLGSIAFIAGFTLPQARKLGKHLPAGGGKLTISLPTGYEQDAAVTESLETARVKGWTLTVQTYEAEAAAATFGMRRVWVRRTQDAQGAYVDADGVRWQVDWCVDMLTPDGSTPDAHGYELYRSTEAAVAYWELQTWVDPEAEELLTTESL